MLSNYKIFLSLVLYFFVSFNLFSQQLTLWEHERDEDQKVLDELITTFQKNNAGITIKRSHYNTEDLRTQFQTAAIGGGGADMLIAPNDFAGVFSIMGIIKSVNDIIDLSKFSSTVVDAVKDEKGLVWGIPISKGNHLMLLINKSLVKNPPKTLEELINIAKKITDHQKKIYGFAYHLTEPFWFVPFYSAFGQRPLVGEKPNLNTKEMLKALSFVKDLKFKHQITPSDCDYNCADTLFVEGRAAMIINGDWSIQRYEKALKNNLLILPLPLLQQTGKYMEPMVSGKYIYLNKKSIVKKLTAIKKFVEYLVSDEVQKIFVVKSKRIPSLKKGKAVSVLQKDTNLQAMLKALEHGQPMPMAVQMRAVWDAMRPQLQEVMAGRTDPKKAADIMQKDAERKIKNIRK